MTCLEILLLKFLANMKKLPTETTMGLIELNASFSHVLQTNQKVIQSHQIVNMNLSEEVKLAILKEKYTVPCSMKCSNGDLPLNMSIQVNFSD